MASKLKVDQIEGQSGSTLTIPTGQTFTITDGLPVTSGGTGLTSLGTSQQILQVNSSGNALEFTAKPEGKLKKAQYFHNTTRITINSGSSDIDMFTWGNFNKVSATSKLYYHGYIPGRRTENNHSFNKFTATPSSGSAEVINHMKVHGVTNNDVGQQFFNLQGVFTTAFAIGNVELKNILSSDGQANRGHTSGMVINPNNSDDSRLPATSPGSHLVVYEIED
tara:strand:+ start:132 stop:797 length:666 start_codon:yes stop_codon:yes gene_type:complete